MDGAREGVWNVLGVYNSKWPQMEGGKARRPKWNEQWSLCNATVVVEGNEQISVVCPRPTMCLLFLPLRPEVCIAIVVGVS